MQGGHCGRAAGPEQAHTDVLHQWAAAGPHSLQPCGWGLHACSQPQPKCAGILRAQSLKLVCFLDSVHCHKTGHLFARQAVCRPASLSIPGGGSKYYLITWSKEARRGSREEQGLRAPGEWDGTGAPDTGQVRGQRTGTSLTSNRFLLFLGPSRDLPCVYCPAAGSTTVWHWLLEKGNQGAQCELSGY